MKAIKKTIVFLLILLAGIAIYTFLLKTKPVPHRSEAKERSTVVEITTAVPTTEHVLVSSMGLVVPAKSVTVLPEVPGRIIYQSPNLIPGGSFRAGELIIKLDPRDYELLVKQQSAKVIQARVELAKERGLKSVAEREWNLIQDEVKPTEEGKKLALRDIQLENAQAMLVSAQSVLEQAELQLSRTFIRAPFDCLVIDEFVDPGQVVSKATMIATLVASDKFWVRTSVPLDQLGWVRIPGVNNVSGSEVKVIQKVGHNMKSEWQGRIIKLLGNLDAKGKMARLLVEVDQPLGAADNSSMYIPLLLDAFVNVDIQGQEIEGVFALPRLTLRDQDRLWVKNKDNRLEIRKVDVIWTYQNKVYLKGDIQPNEQVITSRISAPIKDMLVVTQLEERENKAKTKEQPAKPASVVQTNLNKENTKDSENQL